MAVENAIKNHATRCLSGQVVTFPSGLTFLETSGTINFPKDSLYGWVSIETATEQHEAILDSNIFKTDTGVTAEPATKNCS